MVVNVVHDNRQLDRLPLIVEEFEKYGIEYRIWEACIDKKTVLESITESFRRIIQYAKDAKLPRICIAEDDLMFPCSRAWQYFLDNIPEKYDVYIGGSYLINNQWSYEPPVVKVDEWVGNHLILVNESYYDKWLNSRPDAHIDNEQKGKGDFYVCFPYAALQRPSRSANNQYQEVNYNEIVPKEYILTDDKYPVHNL